MGGPTHKHVIAYYIIIADIISSLIIVYIFNRLQYINNEYIQTIDDKSVTMKDFAIMCQNLKVDKFTQDSRLLKMKVWLHFMKLLKEINNPDSDDSDFDQQNCDSHREL